MRRAALLAPAVLAAVAIAVPAVAGGAPRPRVRAVTLSPLVIRGTHFKAHERVRVRVTPGGSHRVVARASGSFTTTFAGLPVDRCSGGALIIRATGSGGDRAEVVVKLPLVACAPSD